MKTTFKRVLLTVMALAAILMLTACGKTKLELDSGILYQMETTYRGDSNTFYYTVLFTDLIQHPDRTQSIDLDHYKTPSALLYRCLYANTTPESALNDCKGWNDFEIQLKLS